MKMCFYFLNKLRTYDKFSRIICKEYNDTYPYNNSDKT